ncbi:MAG: class A beta-lactamase-related serine hydrolase [Bacteroidia bacterium]|nr:class A beta-lactamase-related serine hydrolase [Bacteroidia bacterium]
MRALAILILLFTVSCAEDSNFDPLQAALDSESKLIRQVIDSVDQYEVQIQLTTIDRQADTIVFTDFEYQLDDSTYFYPASTVKFPVSILTLEQIQKDELLNLDTPFFVEGDSMFTTLRHDIRDIFAVSSNHTFNRLFDYLGKDKINQRLTELGISPVRISHRLSTSDAYNLTTRPLIIKQSDSSLFTTEPIINTPITPLELKRIKKGIGHYLDGELIEEPMDFSERNYLPVATLHQTIKRVFFPESFPASQRFAINENHRDFLVKSMALYPKTLNYDPSEFYDSYGKFFIYGDLKDPLPDHIKIYNKVGYAYGYLTDCAYIVDSKNSVEYMITATIHVNRDGIFNDDQYEYDEIGIPFLAQLGREIHNYLILNNNP